MNVTFDPSFRMFFYQCEFSRCFLESLYHDFHVSKVCDNAGQEDSPAELVGKMVYAKEIMDDLGCDFFYLSVRFHLLFYRHSHPSAIFPLNSAKTSMNTSTHFVPIPELKFATNLKWCKLSPKKMTLSSTGQR